jgi:hypothetical protein
MSWCSVELNAGKTEPSPLPNNITYDDGEQTLDVGVLLMQSVDVTLNFCD